LEGGLLEGVGENALKIISHSQKISAAHSALSGRLIPASENLTEQPTKNKIR